MSFVRDVLAYPVTLSFHRGARLRRNEEQARKHRQADPLIRTRQFHVVSYIVEDMWNVFAVSYPPWVASLWSRTMCPFSGFSRACPFHKQRLCKL